MAGGGPPRKSHTKSRTGCATCKRRHIRCDETQPQCNNCTKHNVRCDYQDALAAKKAPEVPDMADLNITPEIQSQLNQWRHTGQFPFADLGITEMPPPSQFSNADLRLLHHIADIANRMISRTEPSGQNCGQALWSRRVPLFLRIAAKHDFVMHALLGMSAAHLSWLTSCNSAMQLSYEHKGVALYGLKEAVGRFSKENSDAILAGSMLLSWQATEPHSWALLMQGTTTVMDAMTEWKEESAFKDLIDERDLFPREHPIRFPSVDQDLAYLHQILGHLQKAEPFLAGSPPEEISALHGLKSFIGTLITYSPISTPDQQFNLLHPLRAWLLSLPIHLLRRVHNDVNIMVLLAHYYSVCLAIQPLFPAVGAQYLGSIALGPIEDIYKLLLHASDYCSVEQSARVQWALSLMQEFPLQSVASFKKRMGWRRVVSASPLIEFTDMTHESLEESPPSSMPLSEGIQAFNPAIMYQELVITPLSVNPGFDAGAIATFGFGGVPSSPSSQQSNSSGETYIP